MQRSLEAGCVAGSGVLSLIFDFGRVSGFGFAGLGDRVALEASGTDRVVGLGG